MHLGSSHRPAAVRRWLTAGTVADLAARTAERHPDREALRIDGRPIAHADLGRAAAAVASCLERRGARPGDRVLVAAPSSLEMVVSYLGVLRAGCVALLANPALTEPELDHLVSDGRPALALAAPAVRETLGARARHASVLELPHLPAGGESPLCALLGEGTGAGSGNGAGNISGAAGRNGSGAAGGSEGAVLAYTSGSTGRPKGALLSHANLLATTRSVMRAWRYTPCDVTVHCLPLFHLHGLTSLHAVLLGGGRAVLQSRLDPDELASLVAAEHATVLLGVPAVHRRLVDAAPLRESFASLRLLVSGSAPLPPSLAAELEELTGQVPLERYGTTESGLDVSNPYLGGRRPGSVGLALPGVEVKVATEDGTEVPNGTDGEIMVRGPQVFSGYWRREPGPDVFSPGGWWRSGDVGRVDPADSYLSITGRAKELIITGGLNVYPREVEAAIELHQAVRAVAVAGVPSARWGEEVTAFVVFRPGMGAEPGELAELCRRRLAPYKRPKRILVVEELPLNALGKVQRERLVASLSHAEDDAG